MKIPVNRRHLAFLEGFASESRIHIIEQLSRQSMNIKELAEALNLTSAMITKHVQKLEDAGIVVTENMTGKRGIQKKCSLALDTVTLEFKPGEIAAANRHSHSIPIGQYSSHQIKPTCGLVSDTGIIGMIDDPRYFSDPGHVKARHLWFGSGFVEYRVPNYLLAHQQLESLDFSLEICSEAPGYQENWPSDIVFYMNGKEIGLWTCPGDFGAAKGVYTPSWWTQSQHGLLKTVSVRADGSYIDGVRLSDTRIADLGIRYGEDIPLKIAVHETARHCGGLTLFGRGFGNYDQDIQVNMTYK